MTDGLPRDGAARGVTDVHAHAVPADVLPALRTVAPEIAPTLRRAGERWELAYPGRRPLGGLAPAMFDVGPRLAWMDRESVDVQALSLPPSQFFSDAPAEAAAELIGLQNDALLQLAADVPDRFRVLASLPLQDPEASVAEIRRLAGVPAVAGVHLATHMHGVELDDPQFAPVWAALEAADLPAVVHPPAPAGAGRLARFNLVNLIGNPTETTVAAAALLYGGVLQDHPRLRVCLVHGGGFLPYQLGRLDHGWSTRADLRERLPEPPSSMARRLFYDSVLHDATALRFLVDRVGADRVCLGSDHPFDMGMASPVSAVRDALPPGQAHEVLVDSAARLLRQPL
jgi:aminocarboxymuconate-semialdehyde decarboxylase